MSNLIFFNFEDQLTETSVRVFNALGFKNFLEGDSANVLDGIYYFDSIFGVRLKLEYNSYDYDDEYRYMLSIKSDFLSAFEPSDKIVDSVIKIVIELLQTNLNIVVAIEVSDNNLKVLTRDNISK